MTVQIPPGYAQISIEHWLTNYPRPAINVWGLRKSGGWDDPVDEANAIQQQYYNAFNPGIDTNVTVRSSRIVIGQDGGDPLVGVSTIQNVGTTVRDSISPALALMLDLHTGFGGRRNRGRKYLPWNVADVSVSETGAVAQSVLTARTTEANNFLSDLNTLGYEVVILHGTGNTPVPAPTQVISITPNPVIRTQKQRQTRF